MTFEVFVILTLLISATTGFLTEGIKMWLDEKQKKYSTNALAGKVAVVLSVAFGVGYLILTETAFNAKIAVILIALMFLSWGAAMVGYDKAKQLLEQFRKVKDGLGGAHENNE